MLRRDGSEVEPDLMVRQKNARDQRDWDDAPIPILVVEVLSNSTRRRDFGPKRQLHLDAGVADYWIVDHERHEVRGVRLNCDDNVVTDVLRGHPREAAEGLNIPLGVIFDL